MTDSLLTTRQAASLLGVTRQTIVHRVHSGSLTPKMQLPHSGQYLFSREEIERLASEGAK